MALSETQKAIAISLQDINTPYDWQVNLLLLLQDDEEAMVDIVLWIHYRKPSFQQLIEIWLVDYLKWKNNCHKKDKS